MSDLTFHPVTSNSGNIIEAAYDEESETVLVRFAGNSVYEYGVGENPTQKQWTQSPKVYAPIYIDDAALGCPLIPSYKGGRPMVDWKTIEILLQQKNYL